MSNPCLILEVSDADNWAPFRGCKKIPMGGHPTVLHPSREVAEQEAQRLCRERPHQRFAVFEAAVIAQAVQVPSHVTLSGKVVASTLQATLVDLFDDEVPF